MRLDTRSTLLLQIPLLGALPACKGKAANAEGAPADSSAASEGSSNSKVSLPVVGAEVLKGDLILSINTTGQVRSQAVANLKAEVSGTIDRVLVTPGQRVTKGQPLVTLDRRSFDLNVREAEAAVAQATVLFNDNVVPDSVVTGKAVPEDRREIARVRSGLLAAEVRLERAKLERERAVIEAPFNGVVDRVEVAPGERVSAGESVATVVDVSDLEKPLIVAWYEPTDGGVHNIWVEGDSLYVGNYQGGGRVVDISGELKGDLLRQGREMSWLFTAESSGYKSTSTYDDVVRFMKAVDDASPLVHYTTYGKTYDGRDMPLTVVGAGLKDASPASVRATNRLRVHIQTQQLPIWRARLQYAAGMSSRAYCSIHIAAPTLGL